MVSLNQYFEKNETGFQICKRIMGHHFVFNSFFYVRPKQLITISIQSVCIFYFKTASENCNVKLNAFPIQELYMEVGLESQCSFVPSSVRLKSIYVCLPVFAALSILNLFSFPKRKRFGMEISVTPTMD